MTPTELIREWIKRFNTTDIGSLTQLYAENAVYDRGLTSAPLVGREAIQELLKSELIRVKLERIEERIYECGDTAILQWEDPAGLKGCDFFQCKDSQIINQKGYFAQIWAMGSDGEPVPSAYVDF